MNKKEILSWLQQYGLAPNKMYGQHFLFHEKYIEAIVTAISPCSADVVLEIGPGLGVLTQRLSEHAKKVIAVEIDAGFVEVLQSRFANNSRVTIVHNDFLKTNPCHECTVLTGNLPYNIAYRLFLQQHITIQQPIVFFCCRKRWRSVL
ncbi:MAG TPA: rRNA adenine N-6-methyltransferase family protein [Spirochaetota bacterium]|nr:rRNA adenine N-6-methyltransferase family protein [Spirochaetota bacterium]